MGREFRRALERASKTNRQNQMIMAVAKAQANKKRLTSNEVEKIQLKLSDTNLSCVYAAFSQVLFDKGMSSEEIYEVFNKVDDLVGLVGTEEYPTVSDFKVKSCLATGVGIQLTQEEQEEVDRIYDEYYPEEEN